MNRIDDAKQAYMDLFNSDRSLADQLLIAMKEWLQSRRAAGELSTETIEAFANWVAQREQIAARTASLGAESPGPTW